MPQYSPHSTGIADIIKRYLSYQVTEAMNLDQARDNMIEQQIRPWNVLDQKVLDVLAEVPRDAFVAEQYVNLAYCDTAIALGHGQTMLNPNVEGRLLQALALQGTETVLHIGTGSGYLTACLAKLAKQVRSVDIVEAFTQIAAQRLAKMSIDNVILEFGDACRGWAPESHFDVIVISGALRSVPGAYREQLTIGGRLFAIIGRADQPIMEVVLVTRTSQNQWRSESLFETRTSCRQDIATRDKFAF